MATNCKLPSLIWPPFSLPGLPPFPSIGLPIITIAFSVPCPLD